MSVLQVKRQLSDIKDDYDSLQSTRLVTDLDITLEDLIWASDMVTSRSFAFPKQLGTAFHRMCINACSDWRVKLLSQPHMPLSALRHSRTSLRRQAFGRSYARVQRSRLPGSHAGITVHVSNAFGNSWLELRFCTVTGCSA